LNRPASRGRPRDPALDRKIFDVAIALYGEEGWGGFNFQVIARLAGVSKNRFYRRWLSKGAFLRELLQERWLKVNWIHTGCLRGDLSDLCGMLFHHFAGSEKKLGFHLQLNMARYEAVAQALSPYTDEVKARAINLPSGNRSGERAPSTSIALARLTVRSVISHAVDPAPSARGHAATEEEVYRLADAGRLQRTGRGWTN
jgi:AcrR family transcriptional regulator